MTPATRNTAIAAAATLIPAALAAAAAAAYPERTRRLGHQISDRFHGLLDDTVADADTQGRRIAHRLEELLHNLENRLPGRHPEPTGPSPLALIGGGIAAALLIPTVLTAIFAPHKLREARDAVTGLWSEEEVSEELSRVSERLETLSADIQKHREANFNSIVAAAQKGD